MKLYDKRIGYFSFGLIIFDVVLVIFLQGGGCLHVQQDCIAHKIYGCQDAGANMRCIMEASKTIGYIMTSFILPLLVTYGFIQQCDGPASYQKAEAAGRFWGALLSLIFFTTILLSAQPRGTDMWICWLRFLVGGMFAVFVGDLWGCGKYSPDRKDA